ncbi:transposase family protein [Streptomyces griseus]|uniref:transposase family protein n=1 Tax=Streptomyces griseus TaxID=1911 RepID=UPI00381E5E33
MRVAKIAFTCRDSAVPRRPPGGELTTTEQTANRALSAARVPVERGMARLKPWPIFRRSRISPNCMSVIAKAVLTLERQR